MMTVFKRKQQNDEDKWWWELFKWNNKGIGARSTLVFTHHSFDKGHRDGVKGRHPAVSKSLTWSSSNYISLFQQDHKDHADQVDPPSNTDRAFESAREQLRPLSWCCLVWKFPTRISSPDPRRPGKGRRRCPQRHSPTTGCPRGNLISEILGSQIHVTIMGQPNKQNCMKWSNSP